MSGSPADEYFSDGLAEELSNSLTRIDGLKVAARTASFQYKDRTGDVSEIARQLRVATSTVVLKRPQRVGDDDGMRFVRGALWAMSLGTLLWTLVIFVFSMTGD